MRDASLLFNFDKPDDVMFSGMMEVAYTTVRLVGGLAGVAVLEEAPQVWCRQSKRASLCAQPRAASRSLTQPHAASHSHAQPREAPCLAPPTLVTPCLAPQMLGNFQTLSKEVSDACQACGSKLDFVAYRVKKDLYCASSGCHDLAKVADPGGRTEFAHALQQTCTREPQKFSTSLNCAGGELVSLVATEELQSIKKLLTMLAVEGLPPYLEAPLSALQPSTRNLAAQDTQDPGATPFQVPIHQLSASFLRNEMMKLDKIGDGTARGIISAVFAAKPFGLEGRSRAKKVQRVEAVEYKSYNLVLKEARL